MDKPQVNKSTAPETDSKDASEHGFSPDILPPTLETGLEPTPSRSPDSGADSSERPAMPPERGVGSRIGPYKLVQQIGEGGMGAIFLAEQQGPVRRMVAFKVIKSGMDSAQVIARFEAERQALALMDHPNIAKVFDANTTSHGQPYFVMELVKGVPITQYCDAQRLTLRQRLELFVPVCQAIQHAHQKGIIHRDIKPSNVLVASYDGKPTPKVIDFGVAKAMGQKLTEQTLFTGFGGIVGTLEYMSPEQAALHSLDIDTRSDVYSLGVLLYELLTGTTPLSRQRVKEATLIEVLRWIRDEEPPPPSLRLSLAKEALTSVAAQRQMEPTALVKAVRGEVDWIVLKALEKDRTRRYETANALAQDIQRYLREEPVEAGPPSATYRLRKLAWRHRRSLATAAALLLLLVAGVVVSTSMAVWAWQAEKQARAAEAEAKQQRDAAKRSEEDAKAVLVFFQDKVLSAGRPEGQEGGLGNQVTLRKAVDAAEPEIAKSFVDRPLVEAAIRDTLGTTYLYLGEYLRSIKQHQRALALCEAQLGPDHSATLTARNNLAAAYWSANRIADAIHLQAQNLQIREAQLGPDHPDTLTSRNNLANAYLSAGQTAEAIRLHEQTLRQREKNLGPDHPDTLTSRNNLAAAYWDAGRIEDAIRLHEQTLRQREKNLGPDHADTLTSRNNLANAYLSAGQTAEAVRLHEQTLKQRESILGADHPHTLSSRNNLAAAYERAGQFAEAERLYRISLEQIRKRFGMDSPETAAQLAVLGANLLQQRKYTEAEPLLRDSLKIREAQQPDVWTTFNTRSQLGEALVGQKKYADAEALLLRGYQGMHQREKAIPPQGKVRLAEALERLVKLYEATGNKDAAARWRKEQDRMQKASTKGPHK